MKNSLRWVLATSLFIVIGCGSGQDYESYSGSGTASAAVLNPTNHPHGYAKSECFQCHTARNIHVADSNASRLARSLVEQSGIQSCRGCHGQNGQSGQGGVTP